MAPASTAAGDRIRIVDGDTFNLNGAIVRIENIDAPETRGAKCDAERRLGLVATTRLEELLAGGRIKLVRNPAERRDVDRNGRKLRRVLVEGRDVGEQLIAEQLARPWTGRREPWC